ncbi:oxidoreductase [Spiroplasma sp. TIUS-1]|uniref:SDR family oxidoreductase n=1 Tax=Spiroplasma sp. TIUS-1 TaxID=216963 RepID=UPI001398EB6F|nr:SDR family oxidoreductase [Spiroplasma sp. TIUS-1]QHX35765.1 oxidoreductase [Spiroplasma sp. TIUS-1]
MSKKLVAITGASSGIGKALAMLFASKGHPVLLMARRIEILNALPIKEKVTANVDVTNFEQVQTAINNAEAVYGPIDLMINNAGIMPLDNYVDQSLKDKYDTIDVNVKGVINGMDAVLKQMIKNQTGTIVNISSIAGRYTSNAHSIYNGAKSAVNAITEQARKENAHNNIRFILIEPGMVDTNLLNLTSEGEILNSYNKAKKSLNGGLTPEQVADVIAYAYELPQSVNLKEILLTHTKQVV